MSSKRSPLLVPMVAAVLLSGCARYMGSPAAGAAGPADGRLTPAPVPDQTATGLSMPLGTGLATPGGPTGVPGGALDPSPGVLGPLGSAGVVDPSAVATSRSTGVGMGLGTSFVP